jgi:isoprenylcysteine carboxyl methyltransferase (ICMT) family protein YpbQ
VLQVAGYWIIASLGQFWTHRIITLRGAPIARRGPYCYLSHPNYAVTIIETFVLPLAFGTLALATIMTALWWVVDQDRARRRGTWSTPGSLKGRWRRNRLRSPVRTP